MSRTLILMRHAKSAWDDPLLTDFDRPLNARGRASAEAIGRWLAERGHIPGETILSGARRTVETWEHMADVFPGVPVRAERKLYHASAEAILAVLKRAQAPVTMVIGHNPGIADFAGRLARAPFSHGRFHDYPTAATAVMKLPSDDWSGIGWGMADVTDFTVPRDILEG